MNGKSVISKWTKRKNISYISINIPWWILIRMKVTFYFSSTLKNKIQNQRNFQRLLYVCGTSVSSRLRTVENSRGMSTSMATIPSWRLMGIVWALWLLFHNVSCRQKEETKFQTSLTLMLATGTIVMRHSTTSTISSLMDIITWSLTILSSLKFHRQRLTIEKRN